MTSLLIDGMKKSPRSIRRRHAIRRDTRRGRQRRHARPGRRPHPSGVRRMDADPRHHRLDRQLRARRHHHHDLGLRAARARPRLREPYARPRHLARGGDRRHHRPHPLERRAGPCRHRDPRARHDGGAFRPARGGEIHLRQVHLLSARRQQGRGAALQQWCRARGIRTKVHTGGVSRSGALADVRLRHTVVAQAGRRRTYQRRADSDERRRPRQGDRHHSLRHRNLLVGQLRLDQARGRADARQGSAIAAYARHRHARRHRRHPARHVAQHLLSSPRSAACRLPRRSPLPPATPPRRTASTSASWRPAGPRTSSSAGRSEGSTGTSISDAIGHGDLPGIAYVIADGEIVVSGRSRQTPPPKRKLFFSCCDVHAGSFTA